MAAVATAEAPPHTPRQEAERREARERDEMITELLPLAKRLARRYRHSGEAEEDLEQVAYLGLVKAVDRYDPDEGPLIRYAVPTILGELRRHFRDKGWSVHVPRSIQENFLRCNEAAERLATRLGRAPLPRDIAAATGIALEDVLEALDAGRCYNAAALDAPMAGDDIEPRLLGDTLGETDRNYELVDMGEAIGPAFRLLPEREQLILKLRFFDDLTQSEIAERIGISQMHVSRLLRRALETLRNAVDVEEPLPA